MFLELAEALDCPHCRSEYGLVAFVDRLEDRRVIEGRLGCPLCEAEFPITGGVIEFSDREAGGVRQEEDPAELARLLAALFALHERAGGYQVLGPGLAAVAGPLAALAAGIEVISLAAVCGPDTPPVADTSAGPSRVNRLCGIAAPPWPIRSRSARGAAVWGNGSAPPEQLEEATRVLGPEARLVVLAPAPDASATLEALGLKTLAADERALVSVA